MTVGKKTCAGILLCLVLIVSVSFLALRIRCPVRFYKGPDIQDIISGSEPGSRSFDGFVSAEPGASPDVIRSEGPTEDNAGMKQARDGPRPRRDPPDPDVIPDEFVLSFFDNSDRSAFIKLAEARGVEILDTMDFAHAVRIRVKDHEQFRLLLEESPTPLDYSSNYYVLSPELPPKRPEKSGGGYKGFGDNSLEWLGITGDYNSWGSGITIAVLDTGIVSHPALPNENITLIDLLSGDKAESGDYGGHGTAVASLIVGTSKDVHGIAPASRILSVRVLTEEGVGNVFTLAEGIVEAVDRGARVINLSLGTYGDSFILKQAVDFALGKGVAVVAAAGNDSVESVTYPARYNGVLAVSAVDAAGRHLLNVNRGPEIDLAAPGVGVNAAWPGDKGVIAFSGSSAAVPFVSGALAALLSENAKISADDAAEILRQYSDDAGAPGKDNEFGHGILNIRRVSDRNVKGIYDVAVGIPHVPPYAADDKDISVIVYAQNRGTENLAGINLTVEIDGVSQVLNFYNAGVGETVSHAFSVNRAKLKESGSLKITYSATISGATDKYPNNNFGQAALLLPD